VRPGRAQRRRVMLTKETGSAGDDGDFPVEPK
jgi:hypothetical protein